MRTVVSERDACTESVTTERGFLEATSDDVDSDQAVGQRIEPVRLLGEAERAQVDQSASVRQSIIEQEEHAANVVCLQRALEVGGALWPCFVPVDWLLATYIHPSNFGPYLACRLIGWVAIMVGLLRLRFGGKISVFGLKAVDTFVFGQASVLVTAM